VYERCKCVVSIGYTTISKRVLHTIRSRDEVGREIERSALNFQHRGISKQVTVDKKTDHVTRD
jgi:hypothetical protein